MTKDRPIVAGGGWPDPSRPPRRDDAGRRVDKPLPRDVERRNWWRRLLEALLILPSGPFDEKLHARRAR